MKTSKRKGNAGSGIIGAAFILIILVFILGRGCGPGLSPSPSPSPSPSDKPPEKSNIINIRIEGSSIFIDNNQVNIEKVANYLKTKQLEKKHSVNVIATNAKVNSYDQLKDLLNKEGIAFTSTNP